MPTLHPTIESAEEEAKDCAKRYKETIAILETFSLIGEDSQFEALQMSDISRQARFINSGRARVVKYVRNR